ncbi:MAG TPA: hypothetical protein VL051_09890 [Burkholderiaceae bacterium]|nr:hypothetical protein [Burkholderiaceae bacterium]
MSGLEIDKSQRSAIPKLFLWWPCIAFFGFFARRREIRKYRTVDHGNLGIVSRMNSMKMLLGRTIVVIARKDAAKPV